MTRDTKTGWANTVLPKRELAQSLATLPVQQVVREQARRSYILGGVEAMSWLVGFTNSNNRLPTPAECNAYLTTEYPELKQESSQ